MPESNQPTQAQRRRKVLGFGALGFVALYGVGGAIFDKRIESDLESRVPVALAEAGYDGVTAEFSGQTGTLSCATPFADEQASEKATDVAYDVRGVHKINLDRNCLVKPAPEETASETPATEAPTTTTQVSSTVAEAGTIADVLAADPRYSQLVVVASDAGIDLSDPALDPVTLFAPTNAAFEAIGPDALAALTADPEKLRTLLSHHMADGRLASTDLATGELTMQDGSPAGVVVGGGGITVGDATVIDPDLEASNGVVHGVDALILPDGFDLASDANPALVNVDASYEAGVVTLTGVVASEDERAALIAAAQGDGGPETVVDQLELADDGANKAIVDQVAVVVTALRTNLVDGRAGIDGDSLYLAGHYPDDAARDAAQAAADSVAASTTLDPVPSTTEDDAAKLEDELNAFVLANPIRFQPNSATIVPESETVLDQLAAMLQPVTGVSVAIEGHTDSDGSPETNQALSQSRADAVLLALVSRGIDASTLTSQGFGSTQPVLDANGNEDKAASRRVEFKVTSS